MTHAVTVVPGPFLAMGGALEVQAILAAEDNLVWRITCMETGECAIVDGPPGTPIPANLHAIFNTHTHGDHIGVNRDLQASGQLSGLRVVGPRSVADDVPGMTEPVDEGDAVHLGSVVGRVMRTEGHLRGHISYVFGDVLFCGDTLFAGGCGYLFSGPPAAMFDSLLRLAALDGRTRVCCAHEYTLDNLRFAWSVEPDNVALEERLREVRAMRERGECTVPSTIELERATNPFLRPGSPTIVARVREEFPDADLSTPLAVFTATRNSKDTKRYRLAETIGRH